MWQLFSDCSRRRLSTAWATVCGVEVQVLLQHRIMVLLGHYTHV